MLCVDYTHVFCFFPVEENISYFIKGIFCEAKTVTNNKDPILHVIYSDKNFTCKIKIQKIYIISPIYFM